MLTSLLAISINESLHNLIFFVQVGVSKPVRDHVTRLCELGWLYRRVKLYIEENATKVSLGLIYQVCTAACILSFSSSALLFIIFKLFTNYFINDICIELVCRSTTRAHGLLQVHCCLGDTDQPAYPFILPSARTPLRIFSRPLSSFLFSSYFRLSPTHIQCQQRRGLTHPSQTSSLGSWSLTKNETHGHHGR